MTDNQYESNLTAVYHYCETFLFFPILTPNIDLLRFDAEPIEDVLR